MKYVQNHVQKLPFGVPWGVKAIGLSSLEGIVAAAYREMREDTSSAIAYKGGHYERDLLMRSRHTITESGVFWQSEGGGFNRRHGLGGNMRETLGERRVPALSKG